MDMIFKTKENKILIVPFNEAVLAQGANLKYETEVESDINSSIGPLTEGHFERLKNEPAISSVSGDEPNIIDLPLKKIFELAAQAEKEAGKDETPVLDLSKFSGKNAYNKWALPPVGQEKDPADAEALLKRHERRGWAGLLHDGYYKII